jgi:hypothetical protein
MKKTIFVLLVVFLVNGFSGCSKSAPRGTAQQWLNTLARPTSHNLNGWWEGQSSSFGYGGYFRFGSIYLDQEGANLTGKWTEYGIVGAINGNNVVLVALDGDKAEYTMHLRYMPKENAMYGKFCYGYFPEIDDLECRMLRLVKTNDDET